MSWLTKSLTNVIKTPLTFDLLKICKPAHIRAKINFIFYKFKIKTYIFLPEYRTLVVNGSLAVIGGYY